MSMTIATALEVEIGGQCMPLMAHDERFCLVERIRRDARLAQSGMSKFKES